MNTPATDPRQRSEAQVGRTFRQLWSKVDPNLPAKLDPMSEEIATIVSSALPRGRRLSILEAGSGTGRISEVLARAGHDVTLLDISQEALAISRRVFQRSGQPFRGVQGSIFGIPLADEAYDVVWNAGVLEHFYRDEQLSALRELTRVLKRDGLLITLNPSAKGWIYRLGKYIREKRGLWLYGQEFPVATFQAHCDQLGIRLVREEQALPEYQLAFLPLIGPLIYLICRRIGLMGRVTRRLAGGYLLLSVIQKARAQSQDAGADRIRTNSNGH